MGLSTRNQDTRIGSLTWAIALILAGIGLLLFNLDVFTAYEPLIQYIAAGLLALFGLGFFGSYLSARDHWWRLIPAWTLLALAAMAYLSALPQFDQRVTAGVLFFGQAVAFAHVYLLNRAERWWAVIPGGFMLVLGGAIALSSRTEDPATLGVFLFVGMGAVFFLLYFLGQRRRLWWALIPGSVLVLFGVFLFSAGRSEQNAVLRWWPLLLVLLGGFLLWRASRKPRRQKMPVNTAPNLTRRRSAQQSQASTSKPEGGRLGAYRGPAPGATVEILPEPDERESEG